MARLIIALLPLLATGLRVCTNSACKKAGSRDTLDTLHALASTAREVPSSDSRVPEATAQFAFASARVKSCGCLGGCGRGPNVVDEESGEVYYDVYKPASAVSLLDEVEGLCVPEAAARAWLKRMYAVRALRANDPAEALALVSLALNEAGALRHRSAHMLSLLLELRADIHDTLRQSDEAETDRQRAEQMRRLHAPEAAASAS